MRIQSPLFVMTNLARTQRMLSRAVEQLSSGSRINHASDDPAGLSIATSLDSQVRGIAEATRGVNESLSILATAEGAIRSQIDLIQRMRELSVEAATGTMSSANRALANLEVQQLFMEYQRITQQTYFNGTSLLDGSSGTVSVQADSSAGDQISFSLPSTQASQSFTQTVGSGLFTTETSLASGNKPWGTQLADFNNDGKLDIVGTDYNDSTVSVSLGNGDGTFAARKTYSVTTHPRYVHSADLNSDGKLDLIASGETGNSYSVLLGNGDGTFSQGTTITAGNSPFDFAVADINGDGKADLVGTNWNDSDITVYLGNGDGKFKSGTNIVIGDKMNDVAIGDLNGDGKMDVVTTNSAMGTNGIFPNYNAILLGNGDGTFQAPTTIVTGNTVQEVKLADLNGDGKLDMVTTSGQSFVAVNLGNGDGTFKSRKTLATPGANSTGLSIADMNGDGILDIISSDDVSDSVSLFLGNGDGSFKSGTSLAVNGQTEGNAVGDVNGDGTPDIVASTWNNQLNLMLNIPTQVSAIGKVDTTTQTDASSLIAILDNALTYLNTQLSQIGASQNRLQFVADGNLLTEQNLSSAKSQILDTDYAPATADLVRAQILQAAGVSALAQANFDNRLLLRLFDF